MTYFNLRFSAVLGLSVLLSACGDKQGEVDSEQQMIDQPTVEIGQSDASADSSPSIADEPVDIVGTEALNKKLLGGLERISREQATAHDDNNKKALEALSEADRQSLIDLTIESSSKKVGDDANEVLKNFEPQN